MAIFLRETVKCFPLIGPLIGRRPLKCPYFATTLIRQIHGNHQLRSSRERVRRNGDRNCRRVVCTGIGRLEKFYTVKVFEQEPVGI